MKNESDRRSGKKSLVPLRAKTKSRPPRLANPVVLAGARLIASMGGVHFIAKGITQTKGALKL